MITHRHIRQSPSTHLFQRSPIQLSERPTCMLLPHTMEIITHPNGPFYIFSSLIFSITSLHDKRSNDFSVLVPIPIKSPANHIIGSRGLTKSHHKIFFTGADLVFPPQIFECCPRAPDIREQVDLGFRNIRSNTFLQSHPSWRGGSLPTAPTVLRDPQLVEYAGPWQLVRSA